MNTLALVLVICAGFCIAIVGFIYQRRHKALIFSNRDPLSTEQIYKTYYESSSIPREKVAELWNEVATVLKVPAGRLRPTDQFGKELGGGYLITSEDLDALSEISERRAKSLGLSIRFSELKALDDYVRYFSLARKS